MLTRIHAVRRIFQGVLMAQRTGKKYTVTFLGGFSIRCGSDVLDDSAGHMQQVWSLLEYLLSHREQDITQAALAEALWARAQSQNPANALKNLAYRLRTLLSHAFPDEERPFIIPRRNAYSWNPDIVCTVDIERFKKSIYLSRRSGCSQADRIAHMTNALACYKGAFLPKANKDEWVLPLRTHYSSMYVTTLKVCAEQMLELGKCSELCPLLKEGLGYEKYDETLHALYIKALNGASMHREALEHYYYVSDMYYKELGVKVSPQITSLYNMIAKSTGAVEKDIAVIESDLEQSLDSSAPLNCDYEMFKSVYRAQASFIARSGHSMYLVLITLTDEANDVPPLSTLTAAMDAMLNAAMTSLRKSDVISRFSPTQYLLLLPSLSYEHCSMVLSRVLAKFERLYKKQDVKVTCTKCPVLPVS